MVWFYRYTELSRDLQGMLLSIPLWSDFICSHTGHYFVWEGIFQSHYGLILSRQTSYALPCVMSLILIFQSHYGLILSKGRTVAKQIIYKTFNPTMVWFYLPFARAFRRVRTYFQSHYGLILSNKVASELTVALKAFNPTMVWFYQTYCN